MCYIFSTLRSGNGRARWKVVRKFVRICLMNETKEFRSHVANCPWGLSGNSFIERLARCYCQETMPSMVPLWSILPQNSTKVLFRTSSCIYILIATTPQAGDHIPDEIPYFPTFPLHPPGVPLTNQSRQWAPGWWSRTKAWKNTIIPGLWMQRQTPDRC